MDRSPTGAVDQSQVRQAPRALLIVALLALAACKEVTPPAQTIRPVQVWTVGESSPQSSLAYAGEVKARYEADLAFRVGGKVIQRNVDPGTRVKQGQVLAQLDTTDLDLNLTSARAALAAAEADHANAKVELDRLNKLRKNQFIDQSSLDSAKATFDAARAKVASAQAQLDLARNQTGYSELKADEAGIITQITIETGQVVAAGSPVLHMAYDSEREVHIRVGEHTIGTLRTGMPATSRLWSQPAKLLQGEIREVSPAADTTRSYLVKIRLIDPPSDLLLGATADVSLPAPGGDGERWLPPTALFQQAGHTAVWLVTQDNRVQLKSVNALAYSEDGIWVNGLEDQTRVVAAGVHKLHAEQQIQPVAYDGAITR